MPGLLTATNAPTDACADSFQNVFGVRRGSERDDTYDMPCSPEGHAPCVGVERPAAQGWTWLVGWYGSDLTLSLDLPSGRWLWTRHRTFTFGAGKRTVVSLPLAAQSAHAHLRTPWPELPADVKTLVLAACATGPDELMGTSNGLALDPF